MDITNVVHSLYLKYAVSTKMHTKEVDIEDFAFHVQANFTFKITFTFYCVLNCVT